MTIVNPNNGSETKSDIFYEAYLNLTSCLTLSKNVEVSCNDFRNPNFSVLWLKSTQTMELKLKQTFFHGTHSNLPYFFLSCKILKYFNDFYNFHLLISLKNWAKIIKMKQVQTENLQIWKHFSKFIK